MVDFNNETTIGKPADMILKIIILERRYHLLDALEDFNIKEYKGQTSDIFQLKARMQTLFWELQAALKRKMKPGDYQLLKDNLNSDEQTKLLAAFETMNEYLDTVKLTKIDTKKNYEPSDIEADDEAHNL